ncbi:PREDICTED: uncharacterized protein LOC104812765 [Tarenaya hassleriana]|uniref:uncharacterized protein LOC104812765 n=1 Tax=Tarenaya hassleriana TaxID=28532 RepID=UPI00053C2797|nr:PREDICTED: uncharacterized protein LOC104812765 [Tarenaya hassleriana]
MLTTRAWIISSGVVAVVLVVPLTMNISVAGAHNLKPLFFINGIVFFLAASTLFSHHNHDHDDHDHDHDHDHDRQDRHLYNQDDLYSPKHDGILRHPPAASFDRYNSGEEKSPAENPSPPSKPAVLRRTATPTASAFEGPRAPSAKEVKADETESMEDTWEKIKAEKNMTTSDTWHSESSSTTTSWSAPPSPYNVKKKGVFIERIPTWLRMKKEPSMGRDDLNARVEAFIKKFQDEIRLQRLESLRRYKSKLLKRGSSKR